MGCKKSVCVCVCVQEMKPSYIRTGKGGGRNSRKRDDNDEETRRD